ncbi:MAG: phosphatidylglycerophosphatase A [Acidobacteriota bacterium]
MSRLARHLATVGRLGEVLPAPGTTVGSLVGVLLFWAAAVLTHDHPLLTAVAGLVVLLPLSVWACGAEAARRGESDPGPVVLDEVAGQWLALTTLVAVHPTVPRPGALLVSFLLFRVFDVVKPWPIRRLERLPGGWGIVADDLAAGLAAALLQLLLLRVL